MMSDDYEESGYPYRDGPSREAFNRLISDEALGRIWLMMQNGQVAGYIVLTFGFSLEFGGLNALVDDLYVRKQFRRRGLARLGLMTAVAECETMGIGTISLEVEPRNRGAKRLYSATGFRISRRQIMRLQK
jgi:ribosomal protein S18 acetylase RimI-like enzyme